MLRKIIYLLLVAGFIFLIVSRFAEISGLSQIFFKGQFQWLAAALCLQAVHYVTATASYRSAFSTVGVKSRLRDLMPLLFGSIFVNVVAPMGGVSGAALFMDNSAKNGESAVRTAAGILLQMIGSMMAFATILTAGLVYLGLHQELQATYLAAAGILLLTMVVMGGSLLLGMKRPKLLRSGFRWVQKAVNWTASRFKRPIILKDEWIDKHVSELSELAAAVEERPLGLVMTLSLLLCAYVLNMGVLYTLFMAFQQVIPIGSLVAGYAIGILFLIVSFTPQGIGVVEGVMPVVFLSLGVPKGVATVTVLAFRGLTFWLPLVVGFLLLRKTKIFKF